MNNIEEYNEKTFENIKHFDEIENDIGKLENQLR